MLYVIPCTILFTQFSSRCNEIENVRSVFSWYSHDVGTAQSEMPRAIPYKRQSPIARDSRDRAILDIEIETCIFEKV